MVRRKQKYGAVKHNRSKAETAMQRAHLNLKVNPTRTIHVKVRIERNTAIVGASGGFKALYSAMACPAGAIWPNSATRRKVIHARGGRCGEGYGKSPTAAYQNALKKLAKIKR